MSGLGKMAAELLRIVKGIIDENESNGGKMLVRLKLNSAI